VYPFDPSQTDRLNRRITNPLVADPTGTFTLLRWGDAVVTVTPEFTGAFLHGVIGTEASTCSPSARFRIRHLPRASDTLPTSPGFGVQHGPERAVFGSRDFVV